MFPFERTENQNRGFQTLAPSGTLLPQSNTPLFFFLTLLSLMEVI